MKKALTKILFTITAVALAAGLLTAYYISEKKCRTDDLNIIVVLLDTVRADHLSCYGHKLPTTPFIDSLAAEGTLFTNAYATSCWTLASHASLFTGLYPFSHGATQEHLYLDEQYTTLAELLKKQNFQTAVFSQNPWVGPGANTVQGFDYIDEIWGPDQRSFFDKIFDRLLGATVYHQVNTNVKKWWLWKYRPDRPCFVFINYIDAHEPYRPPARYVKDFMSPEQLTKARSITMSWPRHYLKKNPYSPEDFAALNTLYDGEIHKLDYCVKDLLAFLEKRGAMNNTLLIITSDHGENIGDHGLISHVFSLYNSTIHIPLIIRHKRLFPPGATCSKPVQINDLFPTILKAAGISAAQQNRHSFSLMPDDWDKIPDERLVLSEYYYPNQAIFCFPPQERDNKLLQPYKRRIDSAIIGNDKIIAGSDGRNEMYAVGRDPHETDNIYASQRERYARRYRQLTVFKDSLPIYKASGTRHSFRQKDLDQLRALGYIH